MWIFVQLVLVLQTPIITAQVPEVWQQWAAAAGAHRSLLDTAGSPTYPPGQTGRREGLELEEQWHAAQLPSSRSLKSVVSESFGSESLPVPVPQLDKLDPKALSSRIANPTACREILNTTQQPTINFRNNGDGECQLMCGGQGYACTNGYGNPRYQFTDTNDPSARLVSLTATVQRNSDPEDGVELVLYAKDKPVAKFPPARNVYRCNGPSEDCAIEAITVSSEMLPTDSYGLGQSFEVRLDDDPNHASCFTRLTFTTTVSETQCI